MFLRVLFAGKRSMSIVGDFQCIFSLTKIQTYANNVAPKENGTRVIMGLPA